MDKKDIILKKLEKIFQVVFDDDDINLTYKTSALDIEEWDSLNQIKIILACEKEFLVRLNPREVNSFANLKEMVEHLISINAKFSRN